MIQVIKVALLNRESYANSINKSSEKLKFKSHIAIRVLSEC